MLATVKSFALDGLNGYPVDIEVDTQKGVASFDIVGLPSNAIKEARNRVRAAIKNSFFEFAPRRTTVNMAPADVKKEEEYIKNSYEIKEALPEFISLMASSNITEEVFEEILDMIKGDLK